MGKIDLGLWKLDAPETFCVDMGYNEKHILERAFELARTGDFINVKMLEKGLAKEGYARGDPQIHAPTVRRQLRMLCRMSYEAAPVRENVVA